MVVFHTLIEHITEVLQFKQYARIDFLLFVGSYDTLLTHHTAA